MCCKTRTACITSMSPKWWRAALFSNTPNMLVSVVCVQSGGLTRALSPVLLHVSRSVSVSITHAPPWLVDRVFPITCRPRVCVCVCVCVCAHVSCHNSLSSNTQVLGNELALRPRHLSHTPRVRERGERERETRETREKNEREERRRDNL